MENLNAEVCEKCGCMYVVDKPHICHQENSYVPKLNLPRELAREISLKNAIALINSQEQRIGELTEENERFKSEVSVKRKLLDKAEVRIDCLEEVNKVLVADICNATMNLEHITKENERLKVDTVREFAERLKTPLDAVACYWVDKIAKEMLEGENEKIQ